jgi:hypothetical protein
VVTLTYSGHNERILKLQSVAALTGCCEENSEEWLLLGNETSL